VRSKSSSVTKVSASTTLLFEREAGGSNTVHNK